MSTRSFIEKLFFILGLSAGCAVFFGGTAFTADFEKLEKGHFVIYHNNKDLANDLIWRAEYYYKKILGHIGTPEFRPWEAADKCAIYLYKAKADYMDATGAPEWSEGLAETLPFRFSTYEGSPNLAAATFPHELTHMVLRLFMEGKRLPLWMEEGMAQFEEEDQTLEYRRRQLIKRSIKDKSYIRISELTGMQDVPEDRVDIFYAESASIVEHLSSDNLRTSYGKFLLSLKSGDGVEEALRKSYHWKYKNGIGDLEARWLEFVKRKY